MIKHKITDQEFKNMMTLIFDVIFNHSKNKKIEKINLFLDDNQTLINVKYWNLSHLLGLHYYLAIINENKTSKEDKFKKFIYKCKTGKILFSSIIKKIDTNWNLLNKKHILKNFQKKEIVSNLESKLLCFYHFIQRFILNPNVLKENLILYESSELNIKYFFIFHVENKFMFLIGTKKISTDGYFFQTFIPMSFQKRNIKKLHSKNFKKFGINKIKII